MCPPVYGHKTGKDWITLKTGHGAEEENSTQLLHCRELKSCHRRPWVSGGPVASASGEDSSPSLPVSPAWSSAFISAHRVSEGLKNYPQTSMAQRWPVQGGGSGILRATYLKLRLTPVSGNVRTHVMGHSGMERASRR